MSILLPSLHKVREDSKFTVCTSNRNQNYKLMVRGWSDNSGRLPIFLNRGWNNRDNPRYTNEGWAGVQNRKNTDVINPVAGLYGSGFENLLKCPSLETGELNDRTYSNGGFDYSYPAAFAAIQIAKIDSTVLWVSQERPTPIIIEESPNSLNNTTYEASCANGDKLGSWHKFGKNIGYTAIDGQAVILRSLGMYFAPGQAQIFYGGESKGLGNERALEAWPR
ncbi:MAG: hypothetical protein NE334_10830 [Lentisphaeraceae bacterium]|nr:hypothetical protein [Lentisphaeraceae bacterium]